MDYMREVNAKLHEADQIFASLNKCLLLALGPALGDDFTFDQVKALHDESKQLSDKVRQVHLEILKNYETTLTNALSERKPEKEAIQ